MSQKQGNANQSIGTSGTATHDSLWGGRFSEHLSLSAQTFTQSIAFDHRLFRHDIRASLVHAAMLNKIGVLTDKELDQIEQGLQAIEREIECGDFAWSEAREDLHMNIEAALTERIGNAGKKLHTARSRNDQVATDMRLWLRDEIDVARELLICLRGVLIELAEREAATIMPGFTHLQPAQPITFGHHMLAWQEMLARDTERLTECRRRVNVLPLGAAALAGTSYPIDREFVAARLGFDSIAANSLDAVSDRDFAIEFCAAAAMCMSHLSRFSEELALWASPLFGFIELPEDFCTGSSIMPQKKNPDVPELVRGKSGRVTGDLMALLTLMKGQPLAYNKDNQEDKEPLFDCADTLKACLDIYAQMTAQIRPRKDKLRAAAAIGHPTATDFADYLSRKGLPFRDAHRIVGRAVAIAEERGMELAQLRLDELRALSDLIEEDVRDALSVEGSVAARDHLGAAAPKRVLAAAKAARRQLVAEQTSK